MSIDILTSLSATGAVASVTSLIVTAMKAALDRRAKLKRSEEEEFNRVLGSDDLRTLGRYLDETIGQFTLYECATNKAVTQRVNRLLGRLRDFVGSEEQIKSEIQSETPSFVASAPEPSGELQVISDSVEKGDMWNGLARLRRYIENTLRDKLSIQDSTGLHRLTAGRLLQLAKERELLTPNASEALQYAISICNKAVHGIEIPADEAGYALRAAVWALQVIEIRGT